MALNTINSFLNPSPSLAERLSTGKALRKNSPRSSLATFKPDTKRQDAIRILSNQAQSRITDLIPIRHARMAANPFAFYRGGAALMAQDLSKLPSAPITVQLCGDMHVSNFGFFSTTERRLVFGINDFDETLPGHFDWDLKRLAASAMIAAAHLGQDKVYGENLIRLMTRSYRRHMLAYASVPYLELARTYIDLPSLIGAAKRINARSQNFIEKQINKASKNTNQGVLEKLTHATHHGRKIIDIPPLVTHHETTVSGHCIIDVLDESLKTYSKSLVSDRRHLFARYRIKDWARKVVGVGSVGTACWVIYMEGLDDQDPLFLQFKEAQPSVLAPYFNAQRFRTQGERVTYGQRLIQGAPDMFLGYGASREKQFYVRQLRDMKGGISIGEGGIGVDEFPDYARLFGWALANAHARAGDPALLAGYCGKTEQLEDALVQFSVAYSQQNAADYDQFCKAIKQGKLVCATENF